MYWKSPGQVSLGKAVSYIDSYNCYITTQHIVRIIWLDRSSSMIMAIFNIWSFTTKKFAKILKISQSRSKYWQILVKAFLNCQSVEISLNLVTLTANQQHSRVDSNAIHQVFRARAYHCVVERVEQLSVSQELCHVHNWTHGDIWMLLRPLWTCQLDNRSLWHLMFGEPNQMFCQTYWKQIRLIIQCDQMLD